VIAARPRLSASIAEGDRVVTVSRAELSNGGGEKVAAGLLSELEQAERKIGKTSKR